VQKKVAQNLQTTTLAHAREETSAILAVTGAETATKTKKDIQSIQREEIIIIDYCALMTD